MGSTAKGLISGFICRLCSKMNRYVILIYSKEGERMGLAEKINLYLPITVMRNDPLPKTVCPNCVDRLEKHSQMIQMITKAKSKFECQKERASANSDQKPREECTKANVHAHDGTDDEEAEVNSSINESEVDESALEHSTIHHENIDCVYSEDSDSD